MAHFTINVSLIVNGETMREDKTLMEMPAAGEFFFVFKNEDARRRRNFFCI